jgi:hypothetical protein
MYEHVQVSKGQQRAQVSSSAFPARRYAFKGFKLRLALCYYHYHGTGTARLFNLDCSNMGTHVLLVSWITLSCTKDALP